MPVLYSFRRCPYAMRARMALSYSGVKVALREIELKNKPLELLTASAKGTVPVLILPDGQVIDESRDIMLWALAQNDPDNWMPALNSVLYKEAISLIDQNDGEFKGYLDRYKYADRYPEHPEAHYRSQGELFLAELDARLQTSQYLLGEQLSVADIAIMPFIRQFAHVDMAWFRQTQYAALQTWLDLLLASTLFNRIMEKYKPWVSDAEPVYLPVKPNK
ncbi:glutathione S-transferase [Alkalimarinus alittae]|uniref:Glutathione S-transferase n=1 Tax=Alkalimarinus alittae TaxID=2961619 RepID=A0ABY6N316_9ALTE|nr:glutathione S-transferase [Alkalimarinus alittae]UZE96429.1 glutathione S-transferase [Alkalimarinus alittae]